MAGTRVHRAVIEAGGRPVLDDSPELRFPWWSFTKTVLAIAALRLVARGRLPLDELLPGRPYTLRQLLQHRAGVPTYSRLAAYHDAVARGEAPWTEDDLLARVHADALDFAPGEGWAYSNVGYLFVRRLVEETAGADLAEAIRAEVTGPLGLDSVRLAREPGDLDDIAWGNAQRYHPDWVYHGLLTGTARDAARLLAGLKAGRLLGPDLLDAMLRPHPLGGALAGRPWETTGYGLGLMIGRMSTAGLAIGHSGAGPGSIAAVYHFPDRQPPCTAAAFARADDEGVTEHAVARFAAR